MMTCLKVLWPYTFSVFKKDFTKTKINFNVGF